jgi:uncharacterized protein YabN with tetrapyrrole methylase and pyrophosphatase domain
LEKNAENEPAEMACLMNKVQQQELKAKDFGFYWENIHQLIEQIESECREVEEAWSNQDSIHLQEELGDLIHAALSLAVFCQVDLQETLQRSIQKFDKRYQAVVQLAKEKGLENLHGHSFEDLLGYWRKAKIIARLRH